MRVRCKDGLIIITAEPDEAVAAIGWAETYAGHAFTLRLQDARTFRLSDLGPREEACREPINIVSTSGSEAVRLISNLAHTPFELHGRTYASVEAFWQGLKFPSEQQRQQIAPLHGAAARRAGAPSPQPSHRR